MLNNIRHLLAIISGNKLFIGLAMIFLNIASRYIEINLSKAQETFLRSIAKEVLIFTIAFMGTRDIISSIILTGIYMVLANYILNENSNYCVLPEKYKNMHYVLDSNKDNVISQKEIDNAINILNKAKKQEELNNQFTMINSLSNNLYN